MIIKYAHKENPADTEWYGVEDIERIELDLRNGARVVITQKNEVELPKTKIERKPLAFRGEMA